jgi:hypothetical protein
MNQPGNIIQPQIELSNSALLAANLVTRVLRASSEDDVQPQAALAMEALGQRIFVSKQIIETGQEIFKPSKEKRRAKATIDAMKLIIGLTSSGWPEAMRGSISLVKSFLLAMACKVCFTDEEAGCILHQMMWSAGVVNAFPIYASQVGQFISAISGYGHAILPFQHFNKIVSAVQSSLRSPDEMLILYERSPVDKLGDILARVFDALRNDEITQVTLEGARTGLWLLAAFSWLLPEETECVIGNRRILGIPGARLVIRLIDRAGWDVGEWRLEQKVESVIIPTEGVAPSLRFLHMSHTPLASAKAAISAQYHLSSKAAEATGQLAAALVDVVFKKGILVSDKCSSSARLNAVCSESFIKIHNTIMRRYGWDYDVDSEAAKPFQRKKETVAEALDAWVEHVTDHPTLHPTNSTNVTMITKEIDDCNIDYYKRFNEPMLLREDSEFLKVIDPAVHLATEALLSCFCEEGCSARVFRPCHGARVEKSAGILLDLIFRRSASGNKGCSYSKFRAEALEASLPGSQPASPYDLAIAGNGYVAYAKVLEGISTRKRTVSLISTLPGTLRRAGGDVRDGGGFQRLLEVTDDGSLYARGVDFQDSKVDPFLRGQKYFGIEPKADPNGVEANHLLNISRTELKLTTLLQAAPKGSDNLMQQISTMPVGFSKDPIPFPTSWADSIEALAFAEHIFENVLATDDERMLAKEWQNDGIFDKIIWHEVGKHASLSNHCIAMTSSNETLRFFEAGYLGQQCRLLVRQKEVPLVSCLARALDPQTDDFWAIVA